MTSTEFAIGTIGRGCCAAVSADGKSRMSGCTEKELLARCAIVLDLTAQPWEEACTFSITGPMVDPSLPAGTIQGFDHPIPFNPNGPPVIEGRDPRLGNAYSMGYAALDVYVRLALAFGARLVKGNVPA